MWSAIVKVHQVFNIVDPVDHFCHKIVEILKLKFVKMLLCMKSSSIIDVYFGSKAPKFKNLSFSSALHSGKLYAAREGKISNRHEISIFFTQMIFDVIILKYLSVCFQWWKFFSWQILNALVT